MRRFNLMLMVLLTALFLNSSSAWSLDRFVDLGDGSVLDTTFNLRWLKNANCFGPQNWNTAAAMSSALVPGNCGLTIDTLGVSWALPTSNQQVSLISSQYTRKADVLAAFNNADGVAYYWTNAQSPPLITKCSLPDGTEYPCSERYWVTGWGVDSGAYEYKGYNFLFWPVSTGYIGHIVISPASRDFGSVMPNTISTSQIFTISNNGTVDIFINILLTGGDAGMFSLDKGDGNNGTCGNRPTLASDASCTVSASFNPTKPGARATSLWVNTNAVNPNVYIPLGGNTIEPGVSWWKAENDANDSVGSNNGTMNGGAYASGKLGQAFSFDGSAAQYVSVPSSSTLDIYGTHSIAFWVKPNALPATGNVYPVVSKWTNGYEHKQVHINASGTVTYFLYGTTAGSGVTSATALQTGVWTHVVATYDGANMKIYLNGVQDASTPANNDVGDGTGKLYLGYNPDTAIAGGEAPFNGLLDEVGWYNRALSAGEVGKLANMAPDAFSFTAQTVAALGALVESNAITVAGIFTSTNISITGGEYAISTDNGGSWGGWTAAAGSVSLGNQVKLRLTSSSTYGTQAAATVTIGGVSASFSATTIRFIDLGDGTMLDAGSSLRWLKNANCFGSQNWDTAISSASNLASSACGLNDGSAAGDWHLPTIAELRIFVDAGYRTNSLNAAGFAGVNGNYYWSSSTYDTYNAWIVSMSGDGYVAYYNKVNIGFVYVWPVRGGQHWTAGSLVMVGTADFGAQAVGTVSSSHQFTLKNAGTGPLVVTSSTLGGANPDQFSLATGGSSPCASLTPTLAAGASCTLLVTANPTSAGSKSASLIVNGTANAPLTVSAFIPAPTISGITPTSGPATGGTSVTITGTNLTGATAVMFGGNSATITANTATSITAISPAGSPGTVDITVVTAGGTSATSSADQFIYTTYPIVNGIFPQSGPIAGGTTVTITGGYFTADSSVSFGGTAAASVTVTSANNITAVSPVVGAASLVDITVTTPVGASAISSADQFTYTRDQARNITTGTTYATLAAALSAAMPDQEIRAYDAQCDGAFILDKNITLSGGWDTLFQVVSGTPTTLNGDLTIQSGGSIVGTVDVKGKLVIQGGSLRANGVTVRQ